LKSVHKDFSIYYFLKHLKKFNIKFKNVIFNSALHEHYYGKSAAYKAMKDYVLNNPKEKISLAVKNLFKNKFNTEELLIILDPCSFYGHFDFENGINLLEFIEFSPPLTKNIEPLINNMNYYLGYFIDDKLFTVGEQNFYKYSKQKEIFLNSLKKYIDDYGPEFTFTQPREEENIITKKSSPYLFIHILVTLEKQKLINIDPTVQKASLFTEYKIRITVSEKLLKKYKNDNKLKEGMSNKENYTGTISLADLIEPIKKKRTSSPQLLIEKHWAYFKFFKEGKKIKIGREKSRKVRLIQTLLDPIGVPKRISEVFENIKISKDEKDKDIKNPNSTISHNKMIKIISTTKKELQKIKDFQKGRLNILINKDNKTCWLDING